MIQSVYTVAQVNSYIKNMFSQDYMLQSVSVKGEVSNCKYHSSGHIYFTLKDKLSVMACVMFAGNRSGLSFPLKEGMQVVVSGNIDVYERDGKYQLYAKKITNDGMGKLYEKFEQLKKTLEERGLFAGEYKQPLPEYVRTLGVVTAPTGAVVRDIITITRRRDPSVQIILYPAIVQGEQAITSIVNGIRALEQIGVDVMIVGRGGGSMEDLWAFNEEAVAQAIFDCSIPIISAVGHETDTTIADFVADLRAATPSAAAELAVKEAGQTKEQLKLIQARMNREINRKLERRRLLLKNSLLRLRQAGPAKKLQSLRYTAMQYEDRLRDGMKHSLYERRNRLNLYIEKFKGLSPLERLQQGFAFVEDAEGKKIYAVEQVKPKDQLCIHVRNGKIQAQVTETEVAHE